MTEGFRIDVTFPRNTFADPHLVQISTEKSERQSRQMRTRSASRCARAIVRRPCARIPRHVARQGRGTGARVGRHRAAAPPVRRSRRADDVAAALCVVHQRDVNERYGGRRGADREACVPCRRLLGRARRCCSRQLR